MNFKQRLSINGGNYEVRLLFFLHIEFQAGKCDFSLISIGEMNVILLPIFRFFKQRNKFLIGSDSKRKEFS